MKLFLISNNTEALMGMRLAGIAGTRVRTPADVEAAVNTAVADPDMGIVFITDSTARMCPELIEERKLRYKRPLIAEIPDTRGGDIVSTLERYVGEAVGIKM